MFVHMALLVAARLLDQLSHGGTMPPGAVLPNEYHPNLILGCFGFGLAIGRRLSWSCLSGVRSLATPRGLWAAIASRCRSLPLRELGAQYPLSRVQEEFDSLEQAKRWYQSGVPLA